MHRIVCLIVVLIFIAYQPVEAQSKEPFRFAVISGANVTFTGSMELLENFAAELNRLVPRPALLLSTGDVTQEGHPSAFARFQQWTKTLNLPFYGAPGTQDVQWSPLGKEAFSQTFGKLYQSFNYGGCHFVLLDTTLWRESLGHLDMAQIKWLENDLKQLKKGTPIFLFLHHALGTEGTVVDNEEDLLRIIGPHNITVIFADTGRTDLAWKLNGMQCVRVPDLYEGGYLLVDVGPNEAIIRQMRLGESGTLMQEIVAIPLAARPYRRIAFLWDDPNLPLLERRRPLAELRVGNEGAHDDRVQPSFRLNSGESAPMERDERDKESVSFMAQFSTKDLPNGFNRLQIRFVAPDGETFQREEIFLVERLDGQPRRRWEQPFTTAEGIQSRPVFAEGRLYLTSLDGKIYAVDAINGKRRWTATTKASVCATPVVENDTVYVGSTDHIFYALEARNGRVRWKFEAGAPILRAAAISGGAVCFLAGEKLYCLDAETGKERWRRNAGEFLSSDVGAAEGLFLLNGTKGTLYALDTTTGAPKWEAETGRALNAPTVAEGFAYLCTEDGTLHAVNVQTGQVAWTARAPGEGDRFGAASPLYAEGKLFIGGDGGKGDGYALDARSGKLLWRCATGAGNYRSSPALAGNLIVLVSLEGKLSWIEAATGDLKYQYVLAPGHCFATPASTEKVTYATSMNGAMMAIMIP